MGERRHCNGMYTSDLTIVHNVHEEEEIVCKKSILRR